jgi:D-proline reductase (dithiol) PrdB
VALVTSAALVLPGQQPFDPSVRGGDSSYRVLPADLDVSQLRETHRSESFDHAGVREDPNLGFPLERLRELAAAGRIGSVAPRHLSFMGSITAPARLVKRSAPAAARLLIEDEVDLALLVPV